MPYNPAYLQDGETVALDLRPHWWYFGRQILTGVPLLIVLIVVLNASSDFVRKWVGILVGAAAVAWALWLVFRYARWRTTEFVVTSRRVIYRYGVVSKRGVEIPLERVNNINFHQRFFDRIIGAGDLDIESAGRDGESHFDFVRHPDGVQHEIYRQMETRNMPVTASPAPPTPSTAATATAPGGGIPEQIEQLAQLRDRGYITEAEFQAKKTELLGRL
jgi:membrane protein YdbS with pleckstrin-like domain